MLYATLSWIQITLFLWRFPTPVVWSVAPVVWLPTDGRVELWKTQPTSLLSGLTRWGWLDLDLLPAVPSSHAAAAAAAAVCWRIFSSLHLTLIGKQILDVLLLERAGGAAGCTHIQVGGQLAPLLVLVYLSGWGKDETLLSQMRITDHNVHICAHVAVASATHFAWSMVDHSLLNFINKINSMAVHLMFLYLL